MWGALNQVGLICIIVIQLGKNIGPMQQIEAHGESR